LGGGGEKAQNDASYILVLHKGGNTFGLYYGFYSRITTKGAIFIVEKFQKCCILRYNKQCLSIKM
jgi:hypothetical protein